MTHSHDRTLLASLGFADPDKREPLHDLACEYLAEKEQSQRLARMAGAAGDDISTEARTEVVLSKGEDKFRTTIGFLDLRIDWKDSHQRGRIVVEVKVHPVSVGEVTRQIKLYRQYVHRSGPVTLNAPIDASTFKNRLAALRLDTIGSSVKETRVQVLPKETLWILAVCFNLDSGQVETLRRENIHPIHLGKGFTKWFEQRSLREKTKLEEF